MRKRILGVLAAAAAFAGVAVVAPTASAEPNPPGCPKGYVCVLNGSGTTVKKFAGDWGGWHTFGADGGSVFNNGYPYPGADHIQVNWMTKDERFFTKCLHYNPGGGHSLPLPPYSTVQSLKWRGEC